MSIFHVLLGILACRRLEDRALKLYFQIGVVSQRLFEFASVNPDFALHLYWFDVVVFVDGRVEMPCIDWTVTILISAQIDMRSNCFVSFARQSCQKVICAAILVSLFGGEVDFFAPAFL